ncbi:MAG: hypothetical protein Q9P01_05800 [Anaerolineae bacterium]|nr:hypothetical protein [Anaerolineae bacterium]
MDKSNLTKRLGDIMYSPAGISPETKAKLALHDKTSICPKDSIP